MKYGMDYEMEILDCCGLHGLRRMPTTKQEFEEEVRRLCEIDLHSWDDNGEEYVNLGGAMVIITTSSVQINANIYLPELGWKQVFHYHNSNSGNMVYLWVMNIDEFNEKWGAY